MTKKAMKWISIGLLVASALTGALAAQEESQDTEEVADDLAVALQELDSALGVLGLDRRAEVRQPSDRLRTQTDEAWNFAGFGVIPTGLEATEAVLTLALTRTKETGGGVKWRILDFSKKKADVAHHQLVITYKRPNTPSDSADEGP